MVEFLYTRIILVLAAIGLVSMGLGGIAAITMRTNAQGQPIGMSARVAGLITLLLAVAVGYFWFKDWQRLGKCATALERAKKLVGQE